MKATHWYKGGSKGGNSPPPLAKKKERGERGRKKERKIVSLNNVDILKIARRASEGIGISCSSPFNNVKSLSWIHARR